MNKKDLFNAINDIDDKYIEDAEKREKTAFVLNIRLVASIFVVAIVISIVMNLPKQKIDEGVIDNTPQQNNVISYNGIKGENTPSTSPTKISFIQGYAPELYTEVSTVVDGKIELSKSLQLAMEDNKDEVKYRVVICLFQNENVISIDKDGGNESERLVNEGYTVAIETIANDKEYKTLFTIHATKEQIIYFVVNEQYGYYLCLYDEYLGITDTPTAETTNGFIQQKEQQ